MPPATKNDLINDVNYVFSIFEPYLEVFSRQRIQGANICELGPGKNLCIALLFKCLGARNVWVVDKYLKPWESGYHPALYSLLTEKMLERYPGADPAPLLAAEKGYADCGIMVCADDAEKLVDIPDASVDFVCSWAVLEHLYNPPDAFARFGAITKPGGLGFHQVDFRDHLDFSRPLEFLLHDFRWEEEAPQDTLLWLCARMANDSTRLGEDGFSSKDIIRRECGYYGNSWRHSEYESLWLKNGFEITTADCNMKAEETYLDEFIPRLKKKGSRAAELTRDDLAIISLKYVVRKKD